MSEESLSAPQKILLAAVDLADGGNADFTAEALIVAAWQKYPDTFGMKGYEGQYPDSNKVISSIVGTRGMVAHDWLVRVGPKLYTLGDGGKRYAAILLGRRNGQLKPAAPAVPPVKLPKEQERLLAFLLASAAYEKWRERRKREIVFGDACAFWGISKQMDRETIDSQLMLRRRELLAIEQAVGTAGANLSDGHHVAAAEIAQLEELHRDLMAAFARQVALMCKRAAAVS